MANLKDNYCFNLMKKTREKYEKIMSAHEEKKKSIIGTYSCDSPEVQEWYDRYFEIKNSFPYTSGQYKAYCAWASSVRWHHKILVLDDFVWDQEMDDFIQTLKETGIKEFAYMNSSTAVMNNIHGFINGGYDFAGLYVIQNKDKYRDNIVKGIRFKLATKN